jgi:CRP-like cAMP-binding protein
MDGGDIAAVACGGAATSADVLDLRDIDFLSGLALGEIEQLAELLTKREFAAGDTVCREGDDGDRMWLLAKGSVSVRLISADGRMNLRLASLSRGTTIGEMAVDRKRGPSATIMPTSTSSPTSCCAMATPSYSLTTRDRDQAARQPVAGAGAPAAPTSEDLRNRT